MSLEKQNIQTSPKKIQKEILSGDITLNFQKDRNPLEPILKEQTQYLEEHPLTLKTQTSRLNTIESTTSKRPLKTHSRELSTGLSKFLEENKLYKQKSLIPGPGSYETCLLRNTVRGGAFYKGPQYPSASTLVPGPGSYETIKTQSRVKRGYSIGRSLRKLQEKNLEKPGPATYEIPEPNRFKSKTARVVFPKATINNEFPLTPGPGAYNSSHSTLSRRSALIRGKNKIGGKSDDFPSPMDYHPNYQAASRRSSSFFSKPRVSRH